MSSADAPDMPEYGGETWICGRVGGHSDRDGCVAACTPAAAMSSAGSAGALGLHDAAVALVAGATVSASLEFRVCSSTI